MSMFDPDVVLQLEFEQQVAMSLQRNTDAAKDFENRKASWLDDAAVLKAQGKPLPEKPTPAPVRKAVLVDKQIVITFGPELVGNPEFDLPLPPAPNPSGVTEIGPYQFGMIYGVGGKDTMPDGIVIVRGDKRFKKMIRKTPFGVSQWYEEQAV